MISTIRFSMVLLTAFLGVGATLAQSTDAPRDAKAIEVIKNMSAYASQLDQVVIRGTTYTDARLEAGLMVSNTAETEMIIDRPGSLYTSSFDGVDKKEIFFYDGLVTVFSSEKNFYAQASIPKDIEAAASFALEEMDIEAPFLDLIYRDVGSRLMNSDDAIHYLTDKSRVDGVDCHHIAIRGPEIDLQLWVVEGDKPVLRRIMITSKWEGGAPRFIGNMRWDTAPKIDSNVFKFKAPQGSTNIGFTNDTAKP
jgi:hypothetical protein